jgi:hypothetical protein
MDKELRELIEEIAINAHSRGVNGNITVIDGKELDQAHSAILKLFKERMLELIGEDKPIERHLLNDKLIREYEGYNQAKAEQRKKVGER